MAAPALEDIVKPRISFLSEKQIEKLDSYAIRILQEEGVRVDSPDAIEVYRKSPYVTVEGNIVKIKREAVEEALKTAPGQFEMYNQDGSLAFVFGDGKIRFGTGVTNLFWQDVMTDEPVKFNREHMKIACRLGESIKIKEYDPVEKITRDVRAYDVISMPGIYSGVDNIPEGSEDMYAALDLIANVNGPFTLLVSKDERFQDILNMYEKIHGDLGEKPFFMTYVNPVSPLIMNKGTCDKMLLSIEKGVPVIFSSYGLRGATTPQSEGGTSAVLVAESLAGLVLAQLAKKGAPIILSNLPSTMDMIELMEYYEPKSYAIAGVCAEMFDHYGVPFMGTSGSGIGWGPDVNAASGIWPNHLIAALGKTDGAFFVGGNFFSKAYCAPLVVESADVIQQVKRIASGFSLDENEVNVDEIIRLGPGKSYLASKITKLTYRAAYYVSMIFPRLTLEKWIDAGMPKADDVLRKKTSEFIANLEEPANYQDKIRVGTEYIRSLGPLKA